MKAKNKFSPREIILVANLLHKQKMPVAGISNPDKRNT